MSLENELHDELLKQLTDYRFAARVAALFIVDRARSGGLSDTCIRNVFVHQQPAEPWSKAHDAMKPHAE